MRAAILYENAEIYTGDSTRRYRDLPLKENPLVISDVEEPAPRRGQLLIEVEACGICYTDIDIIEGRVSCNLPVIPGHQVVGRVVEVAKEGNVHVGERVGVGWIAECCGKCNFCKRGLENLCNDFKATGCHINGGYAEYIVTNLGYAFKLPSNADPIKAVPLMCAGAIGFRALRLLDMSDGLTLGLFGFGASAHILIQIIRKLYPSTQVFVFSRSKEHRELARHLGADWAGHPQENPPGKLDRAIDFTPVGETVVRALELLNRGGKLVINVIRKQTPITLIYERHLWEEKEVKSVANVARQDIEGLLNIIKDIPINVHTEVYKLEEVNYALRKLKAAQIRGSAVLKIK